SHQKHLDLEVIRPSIGTVVDPLDNALLDNAPMESVIGLHKTECIRTTVLHPEPYRTVADVDDTTPPRIPHLLSSAEYETAHDAILNPAPRPT
ncbi:MAG: hypothetical protein EA340_04425, partial [Nitriliruptor sp.]